MTHRFLVDTNILSEPLRLVPDKGVLKQLEHHQDRLTTACVVWHELNFGMNRLPKSKKRSLIEKYLSEVVHKTIPILAYDEKAAVIHAKWRAKLTTQGVVSPFADAQIASIAQANNLTLVTRNISDFASYTDLKIVNWFTG